MTEQEVRELDTWIAENVFGVCRRRKGDSISLPTDTLVLVMAKEGADEGTVICDEPAFPLRYSVHPSAFSAIKREIERRGWCWQSASGTDQGYYFAILDPIHSLPSGFADRLAEMFAETEELAGCLAFKAAVEATDGEDSN